MQTLTGMTITLDVEASDAKGPARCLPVVTLRRLKTADQARILSGLLPSYEQKLCVGMANGAAIDSERLVGSPLGACNDDPICLVEQAARNRAMHMTFGNGVLVSRPRFARAPSREAGICMYTISDFSIAPIFATPDPSKASCWMTDAGLGIDVLDWNPSRGMAPARAVDVAFVVLRGHGHFTGCLQGRSMEARLSDCKHVARLGQVDWLGTEWFANIVRVEFLIKQGTLAAIGSP